MNTPSTEEIEFVHALRSRAAPVADVIADNHELAASRLSAIVYELAPPGAKTEYQCAVGIGLEVTHLGGETYQRPGVVIWPTWVASALRRVADYELDVAILEQEAGTRA